MPRDAPPYPHRSTLLRLSFYTYSYTDRLEMPIRPALEKIAATGYDGIDVSGTHGKSNDPQSVTQDIRNETRTAAEDLGLTIEAVITHQVLTRSLDTDRPLDLNGSVDLAVDLGAPLVVFHMGGPEEGAAGHAAMWHRVVEYLKRAIDYAESKNVRLAVDGVWYGWLVSTPESFLRLADDVGSDSFGANYDPCYLTLLGEDPVEVARLWKGRIFHGHLKDYVGSYPDFSPRIPGQGRMDYARVTRALRGIGFLESVAVETFTDMDFIESCEVGYRAFSAGAGV